MDNFTMIDAVVAVVIIVSAILAYSRGLVREVLAIAGWVAAGIVAFSLAPAAVPLVREIPVLSTFLGDSCEMAMLASFGVVFTGALILASLFSPFLASIVQRSALGGVDQGLGFLFGLIRGVVLVALVFVVYDRAVTRPGVEMVENSRAAKVFMQMQTNIDQTLPQDAPGWLEARYLGLMGQCAAPGQSLGVASEFGVDAPKDSPSLPQ
mgnify:FL=1|jgi:membrane protein required for colicin V production